MQKFTGQNAGNQMDTMLREKNKACNVEQNRMDELTWESQ